MKLLFSIGSAKENDIVVKDSEALEYHSQITCIKGKWVLSNLDRASKTIVNDLNLTDDYILQKHDKIKIGNKIIYWSNYLEENANQELKFKDFTTYNGRINESNFKGLIILIIGLIPAIYFAPGLIFVTRATRRWSEQQKTEFIQTVAPVVYILAYLVLAIFSILVIVKRIRVIKMKKKNEKY